MGEAREAQGEERRLNDIYVPSVYPFAETREVRPSMRTSTIRAFWSSRTDVLYLCVYPVRPFFVTYSPTYNSS